MQSIINRVLRRRAAASEPTRAKCARHKSLSGPLAVNTLRVHQREVGRRFAGLNSEPGGQFSGLACVTRVTGAPLLTDSLAALDCRLHAAHPGGDHTIFVGAVVDVNSSPIM